MHLEYTERLKKSKLIQGDQTKTNQKQTKQKYLPEDIITPLKKTRRNNRLGRYFCLTKQINHTHKRILSLTHQKPKLNRTTTPN